MHGWSPWIWRRRLKAPGVRGGLVHRQPGTEAANRVMFQGDEVAAIVADTEEQAIDAARLVKVQYEVLPHLTNVAQALDRQLRRRSSPTATCGRGRRRSRATSRPASPRLRTPSSRPMRHT